MGKVALVFGSFTIYWYGLFLSLSIGVGMLISWRSLKKKNEQPDIILDLVLLGVPAAILFARLVYVVTNWQLYRQDPWEALYIWQGGLDPHGALLGVILVFYFYARYRQISFKQWADWLTPGFAAGYIVSRCGSFFTQENFGLPTDVDWGIYIDYGHRPEGYEQYDFFHPIFLYEMVAGILSLLTLLAIMHINKRRAFLPKGALFPILLALQLAGAVIISFWQYDTGHIQLYKTVGVAIVMTAYWLASRSKPFSAAPDRRN